MIGKRLRKIIQQLFLIFKKNIIYQKKEICPAYNSKNNLNCEKQIILLMIPNEEKEGWHYLLVKNLSTLLRRITSKHHSNFYCFIFFPLEEKINLNLTKKYVKIKMEFCGIVMPSEKDKILELKQCLKSDKMPYIIYADIESLILKIDGCANNPEKSSTTKIGEHNPCGYSMPKSWGFDHIEEKHTLYRGKDCMKKFCEYLREHAKNTIIF